MHDLFDRINDWIGSLKQTNLTYLTYLQTTKKLFNYITVNEANYDTVQKISSP